VSALVAVNAREAHKSLVDAHTAAHASVGLLGGLFGTSLTAAVLASIGIEIIVQASRNGAGYAVFGRTVPASSLGNHTVDILATSGGYYAGQWLRTRHVVR